jgi:hypothetical protein
MFQIPLEHPSLDQYQQKHIKTRFERHAKCVRKKEQRKGSMTKSEPTPWTAAINTN